MTAPLTPTVGRGLGFARWDKPPRVVTTKQCEICEGKGVVFVRASGDVRFQGILWGHTQRCWTCDATGRIVTAVYTRGISLTPICERAK